MAQETVIDVLMETTSTHPTRPALRHKRTDGWTTLSWADYRDSVLRAGRALIRLGVQPSSCVVIISGNRPEWFIVNLATIAAGGLPSGIYTTSTPEQSGYIVNHCEAVVAIIENPSHLDQIRAVRDSLMAIVAIDGGGEDGVLSWDEFLALGDDEVQPTLDQRIAELRGDQPCTLIYTSGTTGEPKGVLLSHDNVLWLSRALQTEYEVTREDSGISYLPLSHIAEQVISHYVPLVVGGCMSFAQSLDTLGDDLRDVRPTFFFAVPRVWEKIQARMEASGRASSPIRRRLVKWARDVGLVGGRASQRGEPMPSGWWLANRLVFSKVRRRLGFDRTRIFFTSAAPMARSTLDFFLSIGIPIFEVYGMTECTGPTTFSTASRFRTGSTGWAIPGTDLRIAEDGEILFRGPHIFLGYYKNDEATREALDEDGWLHSGDIGLIDDDGFLYVTDRKKELLITSGGKNVAPVPVEAKLKAIPGVAQAVVIGDRRKFLSALIILDPDVLGDLADEIGSDASTVVEASRCGRFREYLEDRIDSVNATLAPYESIRGFAILSDGLSVDEGTLTPTLKLKRRNILVAFADEIREIYRED